MKRVFSQGTMLISPPTKTLGFTSPKKAWKLIGVQLLLDGEPCAFEAFYEKKYVLLDSSRLTSPDMLLDILTTWEIPDEDWVEAKQEKISTFA